MQCDCGAETEYKSFEVKRPSTVKEWTGLDLAQSKMPVMISRKVCPACGRQGEVTVRVKHAKKSN